jgi:hypothetical protein
VDIMRMQKDEECQGECVECQEEHKSRPGAGRAVEMCTYTTLILYIHSTNAILTSD